MIKRETSEAWMELTTSLLTPFTRSDALLHHGNATRTPLLQPTLNPQVVGVLVDLNYPFTHPGSIVEGK